MNKEIYRLALPSILSNITIPLLSSVDIFLVSQDSLVAMGAVGLGATIFNFIYWNFGFLRMGTTGLTAQSYGAKDKPEVDQHLLRSVMMGVVISLGILIFSPLIKELAFSLMKLNQQQIPLVEVYFDIRIMAAPATLGLYCTLGWLFGVQNAMYPLIITVATNLINIFFGYIFVKYYSLGIEGVAWATVIAQYVGFLLSLIFVRRLFDLRRDSLNKIFLFSKVLKVFKLNRDLFFRTFFLTLTMSYFTMLSSGLGVEALAVNVVFLQVVSWLSFLIDGYAYALESLVGRFVGEKSHKEFFLVILKVFIQTGTLCLGLGFLLYFYTPFIFSFFNADTSFLKVLNSQRFMFALIPLVSFSSYLWDGVFVGLTASFDMMKSMVFAAAVFFLGVKFFGDELTLTNLWILYFSFLLMRSFAQTYYFFIKKNYLSSLK